jgi:hypothetical protein
MKKHFSLLFLALLLTSCTVDKVNLSPLSSNFAGYGSSSHFFQNTAKSTKTVSYTSELSNLISEFPVFSNNKLNAEVYTLKHNITDYIYAIKSDNSIEKSNAYKGYTNSYKNIQNLKTELPSEEVELLNRYLVKIKTNISLIDSINLSETK